MNEIALPSHSLSGNLLRVYDETDRMLGSARQWCGSKGAYKRPSYPCHYCTYRGGLLRQGAVDKAKADDQRHAGERQHHHLKVRKAVGGKQRKIVHDMPPKDVPVISRGEAPEGSRRDVENAGAAIGSLERHTHEIERVGAPHPRVQDLL
jgi:hypothetical protein